MRLNGAGSRSSGGHDADPRVVWDALAARDCRPHGQPHDFRARCPEHDGDNPESLHVTLAGDGTILVHCFAYGCKPEEIVERLGLRMGDLFPSDRAYSGRGLARARREDFTGNARTVANVLLAADRLGLRWHVSIAVDECPCCESPHPLLVVGSVGEPFVHCPRECGPEAFTGGLAQAMTEERRRR